MRFVDEYRDAGRVARAAAEIRSLAASDRTYRIMEVCGGHTHAIFRFGLHELLPGNVELLHGPGCPVCVLPRRRVDEGLALAGRAGVILAAFGDMMRVPGSRGSLLDGKAAGLDVRMVYSPLDALKLAEQNPQRTILFFAIGFETTAPATALTILRAAERGIGNLRVFCNHVLIAPALGALLEDPRSRIDGFIGPGHVSTVIGCRGYEFIAREYGRPVVVAGFEPLDILDAIVRIVRQINAGEARVENEYLRAVSMDGNAAAQRAMRQVFDTRETFEWRGLGWIAESALRIRDGYAAWDAEQPGLVGSRVEAEPLTACCGDVLRGLMRPRECPLFGRECTPRRPIGALMVSSEGACAAVQRFDATSAAAR